MKYCPYCKVEVGGDFDICPLCQNQLTGTPEEKYWPIRNNFKKKTKRYKILLFLCCVASLLAIFIDAWLDNNPGFSWSIIIIIWIISAGICINWIMNTHHNPAGVFTRIAATGIIVMIISSFRFPLLLAILPIPIICVLGMNFIISLVDKSGVGVGNFIGSLFTSLISWIVVIVFMKSELIVLWKVSLLVSCITLIGTLIFKGRTLINEFQKLFSM